MSGDKLKQNHVFVKNNVGSLALHKAKQEKKESETLNYKKPVYVFSLHDMKMAFEKGKYDVSDEMFLVELKALLETRRKQQKKIILRGNSTT